MKVLIAAVSKPLEMEGVSRHAAKLAAALLRSNSISELHYVAGECQRKMLPWRRERADARYHEHFVSLGHGSLNWLRWYHSELPHIAAQLGVDVVHFACCVPLPRSAYRCGTVVTLHDLSAFEMPGIVDRLRSGLTRRIMGQCLRHADAIACVSESSRRRLEAWFPAELHKAVMIPNIAEPDRCLHAERPLFAPPGREVLLCMAQDRGGKGITVALGILEALIRERVVTDSMQFVLIGVAGSESAATRRKMRRLGLESNVILAGMVSDAQLQWCYRHCNLLLAPIADEGVAATIAEPLMAGCPVVCPDTESFKEAGGEMCHYVKAGEGMIQRFADAIRQALALPRPDPILIPSRSSRSIAQKHVDLYERLACRGDSISGMLRQPQHEQAV